MSSSFFGLVNSQTASSALLIHHLCSQKFNNIQQSAIINHVSFGLHSLTAAVFSSHALVSTLGYLSGSSSWCVLVHVRCLLELEPVMRVDGGAFACFLIENKLIFINVKSHQPSRNDHTTVTAPLPVCSAKLSTVGPG